MFVYARILNSKSDSKLSGHETKQIVSQDCHVGVRRSKVTPNEGARNRVLRLCSTVYASMRFEIDDHRSFELRL